MTNIKALLLDLDGTLINGERPFALAFIKVYLFLQDNSLKFSYFNINSLSVSFNCATSCYKSK